MLRRRSKFGSLLSRFRRQLAERSLWSYARCYVHPWIEEEQAKDADGSFAQSGHFHKCLIQWLDDGIGRKEEYLAGATPRHHAKTTYGTTTLVAYSTCKRMSYNTYIIGKNSDEAADKLNETDKLLQSKRITEDYGIELEPMVSSRGTQEKFKEKIKVYGNGVRIKAIEIGGAMRGSIFRSKRVQLVVLDDPEDEAEMANENTHRKKMNWVNKALINASDEGRFYLVWLGTIVHEASLLSTILEDKPWRKFRLDAIDKNGFPLWPEKWPLSRLEERRKNIGSVAFAQEFMNQPIDDTNRIFEKDWWRYYQRTSMFWKDGRWWMPPISDPHGKALPLRCIAAVDPAIGEKETNDNFAYMVMGVHEGLPQMYVLQSFADKLKFYLQLDTLIEMYRKWRPECIYIEKANYQSALQQTLEEYGVPADECNHGGVSKEKRIESKSRFVERGMIYLPAGEYESEQFVHEAIMYPKGRYDDRLDAFSMCLQELAPSVPELIEMFGVEGQIIRDEYVMRSKHKRRNFSIVSGFR